MPSSRSLISEKGNSMLHSLALFAQVNGQPGAPIVLVFMIVLMAIGVLMIAGMWASFSKASEPGWACIVPIYGYVVMLRIAKRPEWWVLLFFISAVGALVSNAGGDSQMIGGLIQLIGSIVSLIVGIIVAIDFAKAFGKGTGFGLGLVFLPFIFYPLLGFGDAEHRDSRKQYRKPKTVSSSYVDL